MQLPLSRTALAPGRWAALFAAVIGVLIGPLTPAATPEDPAPAPSERDLLDVLGYRTTRGAAPGYVEDRACAICHAEEWSSYQEVGMARSFYRPQKDTAVESFDTVFEHAPSGRRYSMRFDGDTLVFRREQRGPDGQPVNVYQRPVDWVIGSGNHSRVYVVRNPAGELYLLPLAWYAPNASGEPGRWGMAPGFDHAQHQGVTRRVRRECMVCHNAYPDVPEGSDTPTALHTFPVDLPEGTGCQRCHGPGAGHARMAFSGARDPEALRGAIVNPGRLSPARRDDICFGCHLQPSVALAGIRRFGRTDYDFRPGDDLADHLFQVEVDEEGREQHERFEINHHAYRLRQSRCFVESAGALSCLTCHDPHRKIPQSERAAHYRTACQSCHQQNACARPEQGASERGTHADSGDCVACHMSPRRPMDVVQTVMTDHLIRRRPGGPELMAPRLEETPVLVGIEPYWPERPPKGAEREMLRTVAALQGRVTPGAVDHLGKLLGELPERIDRPEPWQALGRGQLFLHRFDQADATFRRLLADDAENVKLRGWLALSIAGQGRPGTAIALLRRLTREAPHHVDAWFNLGALELTLGHLAPAIEALEEATRLRPTSTAAWLRLGEAYSRNERPADAKAAYRRALAVEPRTTDAYLGLAELLRQGGAEAEARRLLEHGARFAARPDAVHKALAGWREPSAGHASR